MITPPKFKRAVLQAYQDVQDFLTEVVGPPSAILPDPFIQSIKTYNWYVNFAMKFTGVCQYPVADLPLPNYGSWLLATPKPKVAINYGQLEQWSTSPPGDYPVPVLVQAARAVLHEVGHLRLHRHLWEAPPSGVFAKDASLEDEEEAWIYAMTALAVLLGAYASKKRPDDSSAIAL
jgi:hypothetical protein